MAQITYIGDPNDDFSGPSELTAQGQTFSKNEPTDVSDEVFEKLKGHTHFSTGDNSEASAKAKAKGMKLDEMRALLQERGIEFAKNEGRDALTKKIVDSGGFPGDDAEQA